ncbi:MAG: Na/Pi cotransporter family protein [Phycisphaerales bacterium]|nr:MAG: Na/Pi cotransporter family protein [Phycisphaerales bacterium]
MHLMAQTTADLSTTEIIIGLVGGLALFLFGLEQMASGLKIAAGEGMKTILARLTSNRFSGLLTGTLVTGVVQSSSVTTVLLVGFISAGLMTMKQSIGVILGADIGSTFTAQIIAFKVHNAALVMIAGGFAVSYLPRWERVRPYGRVVMALGLVFFGMNVMGDSASPLRKHQAFIDLMMSMEHPVLGIIIGALFTAIVQSSAATMGIVIMLAGQGFISLPAGIALALGANIGTCATAILASIGKPREAVRAAIAHILFKIVGVLLWLPLIDQLASLVEWITPDESGMPRQIANAHTVFNVINALVFVWFAGVFAWIVCRLVPDRPEPEDRVIKPKYLDHALLKTPALAIETVRPEIRRMGKRVERMLVDAPSAVLAGSSEDLSRIAAMDDDVDRIHGYIITYLGEISQHSPSDRQREEIMNLMAAANHLEHIGDTIETNLVALGRQRVERQVTISEETAGRIHRVAEAVIGSVRSAVQAVSAMDLEAARVVTGMKDQIGSLVDEAYSHQAQRLVAPEPDRLALYTVEADMIENLKRVYYFAKRMAKTVRGWDKE